MCQCLQNLTLRLFAFYLLCFICLISAVQVDEEPAIRTNTTILLGNIASHLNEGVGIIEWPHLLFQTFSVLKHQLMVLYLNADKEKSFD